MNLRWSLPEDHGCPLTMYTIYYRDLQSKNDDSWNQINITKVTRSVNLASLECNIKYAFLVTAWNALGESEKSREWQMKTIKGISSFRVAVKQNCFPNS